MVSLAMHAKAGLLNKSSGLAAAFYVTKFLRIIVM
jgi:hypothetical protein